MTADTLSNLELIKPFCGVDHTKSRFSPLEPFYSNGFACASNGIIFAAYPSHPFDSKNTSPLDVARTLNLLKPRGAWLKMLDLPKCEICSGDSTKHCCAVCLRSTVKMLGGKYSLSYLQMIADLPNAEICNSTEPYALLFRSGEIVGVLMGIKE